MSSPSILVQRFISPLFEENTYLVSLDGAKSGFVVDPGLEPDGLMEALRDRDLTLEAILITHGHADHIAGAVSLRAAFPECRVLIGRGDAAMLTDPDANHSASFGVPFSIGKPDQQLDGGERLTIAGIEIAVCHVPGHTPGHVAYVLSTKPSQIFVGDLVFRESVGRSDFPGGNHRQLIASITEHILSQDDATVLLSGHGLPTTVGHERRYNPFL